MYIKLNGRDNTKQAKSFIFIVVPQQKTKNKHSRNIIIIK